MWCLQQQTLTFWFWEAAAALVAAYMHNFHFSFFETDSHVAQAILTFTVQARMLQIF